MWDRLEKWHRNLGQGVSKETYLAINEQLGKEPDPDKCPPDWEDFPPVVQQAVSIFNTLGDRLAADIGYLGKDYTLLPIYLEDVEDKDLFLEVIAWLDSKMISQSRDEMKKARDKIKRK